MKTETITTNVRNGSDVVRTIGTVYPEPETLKEAIIMDGEDIVFAMYKAGRVVNYRAKIGADLKANDPQVSNKEITAYANEDWRPKLGRERLTPAAKIARGTASMPDDAFLVVLIEAFGLSEKDAKATVARRAARAS